VFTEAFAEVNSEIEPSTVDWPYYGADAAATHYSPLDIINQNNVNKLEIAWRWKAANFGASPEFNYRTTPIMVNDILYATAGTRRTVVAIDPMNGETLWLYRLDEGERSQYAPRVNSGRGLAYWTNGNDKKIIYITPGYHMVALHADTGKPVIDFGINGVVDLKTELDQEVDLIKDPIGSSSPPMIVNDVIVVGAAFPAGIAPPSKNATAGHIRGYDIHTGKRLWIFHTIPQKGEYGIDTWGNNSWQYTGNTGAWSTFSSDPELGYVYLPIETPTGDFYGGHRPGNNLFSQSLVCLDVKTGKRVWHYQTVHHEIWDYDLPTAPKLVDLTVDGKEIPAVAQITKQGFVFVFDRTTGEPVWPIEERPVPQTDVPGEWTSPTQPFPTKPAPFTPQGMSEKDLIDFTPEIYQEALVIASRYRMGPLYTPPSVKQINGIQGTLLHPSAIGGANWPGGAYDPETGILYIPSGNEVVPIGLGSDPSISDMRYITLIDRQFGGPRGLPLNKPPWGKITAINLNTGDTVWDVVNGDTPSFVKNHPDLQGLDIPPTGAAERGGLLVTRSLLFAGEGAGQWLSWGGGAMFRALNKSTGKVIHEIKLPANQSGLPMTYAVKGKQFIVVAIGSPHHPAELVALTIPDSD